MYQLYLIITIGYCNLKGNIYRHGHGHGCWSLTVARNRFPKPNDTLISNVPVKRIGHTSDPAISPRPLFFVSSIIYCQYTVKSFTRTRRTFTFDSNLTLLARSHTDQLTVHTSILCCMCTARLHIIFVAVVWGGLNVLRKHRRNAGRSSSMNCPDAKKSL